jgi:hypothetical protein
MQSFSLFLLEFIGAMLVKAESASQGESDRQRRLLKAIRQQQRWAERPLTRIRLQAAIYFCLQEAVCRKKLQNVNRDLGQQPRPKFR